MIAVKTFDSTGIAPNGRVYASDLNAIQAAAAGLTDLTQAISVGSLIVGEAGLTLSRFGAGEMQIAGALRTTGIMRGLGGLYAGQFTTTARNAIGAGLAPNGLIIFNTTTGQFEWNSGTDGARVWKPLGIDLTGDLTLTGGGSSLDFTDETASNYFLTAKRTADTIARFAIREDGLHEWGPGGSTARDATLTRSAAGVLALGASNRLDLGSAGIRFSDGNTITGADSITGALIAAGAVDVSELAAAVLAQLVPTGSVFQFAGSAAPTGYLLCDGSSVLRASWPALFSVIGTTYGSVDGTHFTLPDLRGRVPVGVNPGGPALVGTLGANDGRSQSVRNISHIHQFNGGGGVSAAAGSIGGTGTAANTTGDANNVDYPAFLALNCIIKT